MSGYRLETAPTPVWRGPTGTSPDDRVTEMLAGEPVVVVRAGREGRVGVVLPWQPSSLDPRGYPGYVDPASLGDEVAEVGGPAVPAVLFPTSGADPVVLARSLLGTPYLWGGLSTEGIDCSGLVHVVHRALGTVVPRDACDQATGLTRVPSGREQPGDLCFFARPGSPAHHVAMLTGPGVVLHASDRDGGVVEAPLAATGRAGLLAGYARVGPALP